MAHQNWKATKQEMAHARQVIAEASPEYVAVFGGHSNYGGHRAPRDHTISFRLRDQWGKFHSNVIWVPPKWLSTLTVADMHALVKRANGKRNKRRQC